MSAFRWGYTAGLVLVWLPFVIISYIGIGARWVADRIVDLIDRIHE